MTALEAVNVAGDYGEWPISCVIAKLSDTRTIISLRGGKGGTPAADAIVEREVMPAHGGGCRFQAAPVVLLEQRHADGAQSRHAARRRPIGVAQDQRQPPHCGAQGGRVQGQQPHVVVR